LPKPVGPGTNTFCARHPTDSCAKARITGGDTV
jgi:hypothetical protein